MVKTNFLAVKTSVRCILMKKPKDDWVIHTTYAAVTTTKKKQRVRGTTLLGLLFLERVAS